MTNLDEDAASPSACAEGAPSRSSTEATPVRIISLQSARASRTTDREPMGAPPQVEVRALNADEEDDRERRSRARVLYRTEVYW